MKEKKLTKYFDGNASEHEIREIYDWYTSSKENEDAFYVAKARHVFDGFNTNERKPDVEKSWEAFQNLKIKDRTVFYRYAASVAFLVICSYFIVHRIINRVEVSPQLAKNFITLDTGDGNVIPLLDTNSAVVKNRKGLIVCQQQGGMLQYKLQHLLQTNETVVFNRITVPFGKTYKVQLSDGTKVSINSGSSLTYPVSFGGQNRSVQLNGEAYFEVRKDSLHPFLVKAGELHVQVLGTKFNVSSYPDDNFSTAALVEGAVAVYHGTEEYTRNKSTILKPGEIASWEKDKQKMAVGSGDVVALMSWSQGKIAFKNEPFYKILKQLERRYDVVIMNQNHEYNDEKFTASFEKENIRQVMETFRIGYGLHYKIDSTQIIIKP